MSPVEQKLGGWRAQLRQVTGDYGNALIASLVVVALGAFAGSEALRHAEESAAKSLQARSESKRPLVDLWLNERRVDMRNLSLATGALFQNDEHCLKQHARCAEHLAELIGGFRESGRFQGMAVLNPGGEFNQKSGHLGSDGFAQQIKQRAERLSAGEAGALGFVADEGRPTVAFLQPLAGVDGRRLVGVIDATLHLRPILTSLMDAPGSEAVLVRVQAGTAIRMSPDGRGGLMIRGGVPSAQTVLAHLVSGKAKPGEPIRALDYNGKEVLAVGVPIEGVDWWLVVRQQLSEVRADAWPVLSQIGLVVFLCLGGIWGLLIVQRQRIRLEASRQLARERQERLQTVDLLTSLADSSADIIFAKDLEHRYLLFNSEAQRQTGLKLEQVLGRRDEDLLPRDRAKVYDAQDEEVFKAGQSLRWDVEVGDDEVKTMSVVKSPLRDESGRICGLVGIARDITEAKQAEARLRASEARFKALFDASNVAFFLQNLETGALIDANRQALLESGCASLQEMSELPFGQPPYSLDDMLAHVGRLRDAWGRGETAAVRMEWLATRRDGKAYWQDVQLSVLLLEGRPYLLGAAMNIDDRKRGEETILRLSLALDQSPVSVLITNPQGVIEYVNAAFSKSSGYTAQEAVGAKASLLASGETPRADYASMWTALRRGESWEGRLKNRRKTGETYMDQVAIYPLRQSDGRISHYVGLQQDVSESLALQHELEAHRNRLEDLVSERTAQLLEATRRAEEANASKSAFLANMSHEIRTPMNAVLGSTGLIQRDLRALEGQAPEGALAQLTRRADQIEQSARHLLGLLNDLLDLSKIEANKLQILPTDFTLQPLVASLFDMVRERASANRVVLDTDLSHVSEHLHGDGMRLGQILLNFLSNAVRFTEDGRVTLRARARTEGEAQWVRFEVQDEGIGIAAEQQARLFRAFEQAELDTTHRFGGTGLGLAISKRLAELMGGRVGMHSKTGEGSCFWVDLPMEPAQTVMPPPAPAQQAEALLEALRVLGPRHVLLVDDMEINLEIARDMLEDAGIQVTVATDGIQALDLARLQAFDLVLMDLRMPRMGGIEATQGLRAIPQHAGTPVIALTAQAFDEDREACRQAGMNDHLSKPVLPEQLYACLLRWFQEPSSTQVEPAPPAPAVQPEVQAAAPLPAREGGAELPAWLQELEGFDLAVVQRLLGKRLARLPSLLARFGREQGDAGQRIAYALEQGDRETAGRIAHSLKGTSASLGLRAISALAADVEYKLRDGESVDLAPLSQRLAKDAALLVGLEPSA